MPESGCIQRSGLSPERLRRLHRSLQGYVQRGEIAGIVALIRRHSEEAHVETLGWQDKEAQIPNSGFDMLPPPSEPVNTLTLNLL